MANAIIMRIMQPKISRCRREEISIKISVRMMEDMIFILMVFLGMI